MPDRYYERAFSQLAPGGFYVAIRVGFYAPEREVNTFSANWTNHYTRNRLALMDPYLRWCHEYRGAARWDTITAPDGGQVAAAYRSFGMAFGASVAVHGTADVPKRSFGIFARTDRPYTDEDLLRLLDLLQKLHDNQGVTMTKAQSDALRLLSEGRRYKEIAALLGISVSAVKIRLHNAAERLEAATPTEAVSIASARGLL